MPHKGESGKEPWESSIKCEEKWRLIFSKLREITYSFNK
jgi:hypothetical protein